MDLRRDCKLWAHTHILPTYYWKFHFFVAVVTVILYVGEQTRDKKLITAGNIDQQSTWVGGSETWFLPKV